MSQLESLRELSIVQPKNEKEKQDSYYYAMVIHSYGNPNFEVLSHCTLGII